jgi:hypothetical protein
LVFKINCKHNDRGAWCKHQAIRRNLFGVRCCVLYPSLNGKTCEYLEKYAKPKAPPPPPRLRKPSIEIVLKPERNKK